MTRIPISEDELYKFLSRHAITQMSDEQYNALSSERVQEVLSEARSLARKMIAAEQMYEALKAVQSSERHSPCWAGGYGPEGVCPNTCACGISAALAAAEKGNA